MPKTIALWRVSQAGSTIKADQLFAGEHGDLEARYTDLIPTIIHGKNHLLAPLSGRNECHVFELSTESPFFNKRDSIEGLPEPYDNAVPFVMANRSHVVTYRKDKGIFSIVEIGASGKMSQPLVFYRNHEPGVSQGFSTVKCFLANGAIALMGYNDVTGHVALYTVSSQTRAIDSVSPSDLPPLQVRAVWSHDWAKQWVRFVFFQFGGATFFLKTNIGPAKNVNIDHIHDDLTQGTFEVSTQRPTMGTQRINAKAPALNAECQEYSLVELVTLGDGDPHFVGYRSSGEMKIHRIHSDCCGWHQVSAVPTLANATRLTTVRTPEYALVMLY